MATLKRVTRLLLCVIIAFVSLANFAASPEVDRGIAWLTQEPRTDGSVTGDASSIATVFQARTQTQTTLKQLGPLALIR